MWTYGLLEYPLQKSSKYFFVEGECSSDDKALLLDDKLYFVDETLQTGLDAWRFRVGICETIPRFLVSKQVLGDELAPVDEELMLVDKETHDAGTFAKVFERRCTFL